ncbi:hypothetical protein FRE64_12605 [Euhalothece natronophila Z-M001]|uniref:Glycosyltransferase family 4 protein n=1 Tax=Euhalothece natronophila Z-M001 TaxID=522448 RepID=A0A5B8NNS4_9CHRO|nr:hypothetical protein [Euhalothece natronophila]QDZ40718.1 hypothetical protein FRE64_12605 [Euhalothece natronophila Z-M001]
MILDVQNFLFSDFLPTFLHIQWPEAIYKWRHKLPMEECTLTLLSERLEYYKTNKVPIVCTFHNKLPHSNPSKFDQRAYELIYGEADIIVHHGENSIKLIKEEFPATTKSKHIICPHGPYTKIPYSSQGARQKYKIPNQKFSFLFFGRMRKNKGVNFAGSVFQNFKNKQHCFFSVGPSQHKNILAKFEEKTEKATPTLYQNYSILKQKFFASENKRIFHKSILPSEIPEIMAASDVVFLGHLDGINSGVLALGISYGKPVVFPNLGNFQEQAKGWEWYEVYEPGNIESAVSALNRMMKRLNNNFSPGQVIIDNTKWYDLNSWDIHVDRIQSTIKKIVNSNYSS